MDNVNNLNSITWQLSRHYCVSIVWRVGQGRVIFHDSENVYQVLFTRFYLTIIPNRQRKPQTTKWHRFSFLLLFEKNQIAWIWINH